jgi:hypothetical protein
MTRTRNGQGTAALVLAIAGLVVCWSVLGGIACGVLAIVLGFLGRGRSARGEADNGAVATAGVALGFLAVVVSLVFVAIWSYAWRDVGGTEYLDCAVRAGNDQHALQGCTDKWIDGVSDKFGITPTPGST